MQYLYHGTKESGIKELKPKEAGHGKKYVYATREPFAVIFINRPGGSLVADWGLGEDGVAYYVEKIDGIFDKNYSNVSGSLYALDESLFFQDDSLDRIEFVSDKTVPVIKEIQIQDLKKYLEELENKGELNIINYKERLNFFPTLDEDSVKDTLELIEKYGKDRILPNIRTYRPDILDEVLRNLDQSGQSRTLTTLMTLSATTKKRRPLAGVFLLYSCPRQTSLILNSLNKN